MLAGLGYILQSSISIGLGIEGEQSGANPSVAEFLLYVILGLDSAGFIIPGIMVKMGQARYRLVLYEAAALEFGCLWHPCSAGSPRGSSGAACT